MYPIILSQMINSNFIIKERILFLSCISFEERSTSAAIYLNHNYEKDIIWAFFKIIDNGSQYEEECKKRQDENYDNLIAEMNLEKKDPPKIINLIERVIRPDEELISYYKQLIKKNPGIKTLILDITCIPKVCFFPFLKWLLEGNIEEKDFFVIYTKPGEYGEGELSSEPYSPKLIIGEPLGNKDIIWIPSLGFKSEFTKKCWDYINNIRNSNKRLDIKILPLLGFPAFKPDYFDRSLLLHYKSFSSISDFRTSLKDEPVFATADDPYDVYNKISKIVESNKEKDIVLSPVSTKPMSVGIALAAIIFNLRVIIVQAKTYSPNYSKGEGEISVYLLKRDGVYTF